MKVADHLRVDNHLRVVDHLEWLITWEWTITWEWLMTWVDNHLKVAYHLRVADLESGWSLENGWSPEMVDHLRMAGNLYIPEVGGWMILSEFGENSTLKVFAWRSQLQMLLTVSTQKALKAQVRFSSNLIIFLTHFETTGEFEKRIIS